MCNCKLSFLRDNACIFYFILCWLTGMSLGSFVSLKIPDAAFSWMRTAEYHGASIVGMLAVSFFPFFLCVISAFLKRKWNFCLLAFLQGFLFLLVSDLYVISFGSCGWLVRLLLMLPAVLNTTVFWFFSYIFLYDDRYPYISMVVYAIVHLIIIELYLNLIFPFYLALLT